MPPAKYFEENATSKIFRTKNATRKSKTKKCHHKYNCFSQRSHLILKCFYMIMTFVKKNVSFSLVIDIIFLHPIYSQEFALPFNICDNLRDVLQRLSQTSENLIAELFSTVSFATSITSEGSAPVFPNSMLLLLRIRSSGPTAEAGTAGTGSGTKTSETSGASGNGCGWTAAGIGGRVAGGGTLVPQLFFGTALLTLIGTRLCSLWHAWRGTSSHLVRGSFWQISSATEMQTSFGTEMQLSSGSSWQAS